MEELKLYEGRPADCTGRLEKEIRTYDLLDKLGIQFWRTDHGWMKADTMEAVSYTHLYQKLTPRWFRVGQLLRYTEHKKSFFSKFGETACFLPKSFS